MKILAIETSCDETAAAVVECIGNRVFVRSNIVGSQAAIHEKYGGVVPEIAARSHVERIIPTVAEALGHAGFSTRQSYQENIDAIAVTVGPGLMVSLLVGVETAKALSYAWGKPFYGINHLEGHLYSVLADATVSMEVFNSPAIALIVSGGHTEIMLVEGLGQYRLLGKTRDDAAGEAFDKVAKMLGLPYPGGPALARAAEQGSRTAFSMPRPMINSGDWDFSFAGIKTHVLYLLKDLRKDSVAPVADIAASFQEAVCDTLIAKAVGAALEYKAHTLIVVGGVSANKRLRDKMRDVARNHAISCLFPPLDVTGDNAAMIGIAGHVRFRLGAADDVFCVTPDPNLTFTR